MTIRRRLFISNILMIVIPIAAYVIVTVLLSLVVVGVYRTRDLPPLPEAYFEAAFAGYMPQIAGAWLALIILMVGIIFLTNKRLTRVMLKTILSPLYALSFGVRQIRDNDLGFRLDYREDDEFRPVCEAFNEMAARLETMTAERQKGEENRRELIAGISHDLRTPLTSIKAYLEGLETGVASTPQRRRQYLETIQNKANELDHIINRLFLFSKLDIGDFPVNSRVVDAGKLLAGITAELAGEYARRGLTLAAGVMEPGLAVALDPVLFRGVIVNILENSVQYRDAEQGRLTLTCRPCGKTAVIRLADDGPGVPREALDKLFGVFYRADPSRNTRGSGLGLAISKKIIALMGGGMSAELPGGRGLAIIISLPLADGTAP
ncbi:MAG: HAMP domain-containing histidine kinase [Spirochaetaceae bacterium]|jgi:signal transduction histidine kinase|nr:HAMP domain-containing histidine kinase [Spirochaetaceae bacterium]